MHDRLTTTDTGHYAGVWYELPDGTKRYWTLEEVEAQRLRNMRGKQRRRTAELIERVRDRNAKRSPIARTTTAEPEPQKLRNCSVCEREFIYIRPNQATCGADGCKRQHKLNTQRKARLAYEQRQKEMHHATG